MGESPRASGAIPPAFCAQPRAERGQAARSKLTGPGGWTLAKGKTLLPACGTAHAAEQNSAKGAVPGVGPG